MNSTTDLNVAIVGIGFMGSMHAQIYGLLPQARLAAAADLKPQAAGDKLAALGFGIPVYSSLRELLLRHPEIDVVDLCTPSDAHEGDALVSLASGKHLFCEKPLTLSLAAADRIIEKAEQTGKHAQVGHCIRFWPEYQALRKFKNDNAGGRLLSLSMQRMAGRPKYSDGDWLNDPRRSGGAALDLHIHDTDFVAALLGRPIAVTSRATFDYSGPSHIFTLFDYPGIAVSAEGGWNYPEGWGFRMVFQAIFESACLDFDSSKAPTLSITWDGRPPEPMPFAAPNVGQSTSKAGNISSLGGYFNELQQFIAGVKAGHPPSEATLRDSRLSLEIVFSEIESARSRSTVSL